jgi:copper resistance protein C
LKKIIFLILFLLIAFAPQAAAHTQLMSSDPEEGEVVTEDLHTITLTFGENIEEGSTFDLLDSDGNPLLDSENISIEDEEVIGTLPNPLADGEYEVDWYTISADGHPIEGAFTFTVDREEEASAEESNTNEGKASDGNNTSSGEESTENNSNENPENGNIQKEEETQTAENETEQTEENGSSLIIPLVTAGLIAVIIVIFIWLRKRDK